jgi:hypothetical protein
MHRSIKPHPHHLRYAACIIAVGLVDLCLQHGPQPERLEKMSLLKRSLRTAGYQQMQRSLVNLTFLKRP